MNTLLRIRGIYSTAFTKLALDHGFGIADPSRMICERFDVEPNDYPADISIDDAEDRQGVELYGAAERICQLITFFQEHLLDAALLKLIPLEDSDGGVMARLELPGASKQALDTIRRSVAPTVCRHHRFRTIASKPVEQAETYLLQHPERQEQVEKRLFSETILLPLEKTGRVRLEHMRPSGKPMRPREGTLVKAGESGIVFRRSFSNGRYDGLDVPIEPGDYCITEAEEGAWCVKHGYYRKSGALIGEYFNINTPVELYPYGARYLDLEIDVIRRAGSKPFLIDQEKLNLLLRQGSIGMALLEKAISVADELMRSLSA